MADSFVDAPQTSSRQPTAPRSTEAPRRRAANEGLSRGPGDIGSLIGKDLGEFSVFCKVRLERPPHVLQDAREADGNWPKHAPGLPGATRPGAPKWAIVDLLSGGIP